MTGMRSYGFNVLGALVVVIAACGGSDFGGVEEPAVKSEVVAGHTEKGSTSSIASHKAAVKKPSPRTWFWCGESSDWGLYLYLCPLYDQAARDAHCRDNCGNPYDHCTWEFGSECAEYAYWYSSGCGDVNTNNCRSSCWTWDI